MAKVMVYEFDGKIFTSEEKAMEFILEVNPCLLDDTMWDYFDRNVGEIEIDESQLSILQ